VYVTISLTVLIQSSFPALDYIGMVSDRGLLSWFSSYAQETPSLQDFFSNSLQLLSLPSLHIYSSVVASKSTSSVLDAMILMSEEGVSSVAVLDEDNGTLLSAVSVTDIGKVRFDKTHSQPTNPAYSL
jgi:CBS domain-containing protein